MERIYLECTQGNHYKFWAGQIETQNGVNLVTRWGRIGTLGQSKIYNFSTIASAQDKLAAIVREKLNKGYREIAQSPDPTQPDGTIQAVKLLVELAIASWTSPDLVSQLLEDAEGLAPHLDWEVNELSDLEQLRESL